MANDRRQEDGHAIGLSACSEQERALTGGLNFRVQIYKWVRERWNCVTRHGQTGNNGRILPAKSNVGLYKQHKLYLPLNSNEQITACVERCCSCCDRHLEVWQRPGSDTARRTSLARRPRPGVFKAGSDSSLMSELLRIAVPVRLLRFGRKCWHSAAPAFRQPSSSTSLLAQHLRPSGLFSCLPHSLELCAVPER